MKRKCTKGYNSKQVTLLANKLGFPGGTPEAVLAEKIGAMFGAYGSKRVILKWYFDTKPEIVGCQPYVKKHLRFVYCAGDKGKANEIENFYESREWRELRYKALVKYGATCQCCGASRGNGVVIHVDHIKPRSKFPALQLELSNLQILCADCNLGKSNKDATDWRQA